MRRLRDRMSAAGSGMTRNHADWTGVVPENTIRATTDVSSGALVDMPTDANGRHSRNMGRAGAEVTRSGGCARILVSDGRHETAASRAQAARR